MVEVRAALEVVAVVVAVVISPDSSDSSAVRFLLVTACWCTSIFAVVGCWPSGGGSFSGGGCGGGAGAGGGGGVSAESRGHPAEHQYSYQHQQRHHRHRHHHDQHHHRHPYLPHNAEATRRCLAETLPEINTRLQALFQKMKSTHT